MTKTRLENTEDDERWRGKNNNIIMVAMNGKIATNNNKGVKKGMFKIPRGVSCWIGKFYFWSKGGTKGH
jgi:hypothetical protein